LRGFTCDVTETIKINKMETAEAKLRNQLSPLYGLAETILRLDDHPKMRTIIFDMAKQAIKNKEAIDLLLVEIEASKISSNAMLSDSLPSVEQLREISKDRPDTFLTGALYIIDLIERGNDR